MEWPLSPPSADPRAQLSNVEEKRRAATQMSARLRDNDVVGVGSGSTSLLTLDALVERARQEDWNFTAITTSIEMEMACRDLGVATTNLLSDRPDWSFDGADEVDANANMIKGRGGAMLRERLIMTASPDRYVVIDASKRVEHLGQHFPVPLEVFPEALNLVLNELDATFDVKAATLRMATGKDGPIITEHGNLIVDASFDEVHPELSGRLDSLPGVVGTGLFIGFHPTIVGA
jgi:ribose 5-phosphate isomerase A